MLTPVLEKLLILQDRDARRRGIEAQIASLPREVAVVEAKIAAEKAAIEAARTEVRDLEVRKKALENEIGVAEGKLATYKTQQAQVRKNDEYQALGHQIESTQAAIGALEEQELEVMYQIDTGKAKFAAAEKVLKDNIAGHEARIRMLNERVANLKVELVSAQADFTAARQPVEEPALRLYDRIAAAKFPVCAPLRGNTCGGCHLKVSAEVESAARGKQGDGKIPTCDQCGRIVYWEA